MNNSLFMTEHGYRAFQQIYTSYPAKLFVFVYPWDYSIYTEFIPGARVWRIFFKCPLSEHFTEALNQEIDLLIHSNAIHHANKLT